jgi:hypothetical protein
MPTPAGTPGGGFVSSTAVLVVTIGLLGLLLANQAVQTWLKAQAETVRTHMYGPRELHQPATTHSSTEDSTLTGNDAEDPDDGFDYGIFSSTAPPRQ